MTRLGRAAATYAEMGLRVFPLRVGGKEPSHLVPPSSPGAGDGGLHLATTDSAQIEAWWAACPEANVGIATGPSEAGGGKYGVFALDVDVKDHDGFASLAELLRAAGGPLIETPWQTTGLYERGRGRQYLFAYPAGETVRNSAGKLGPGLDIRGAGGYIVAPPSVHPSGVAYQWDAEAHPLKMPFAAAPEWLLASLRAKKAAPVAVTRPSWDSVPVAYVRAALDGEYELVAKAGPGTRNDTLNKAAFKLGGLVAVGALGRAIAEQALTAAAAANGQLGEDGPGSIAAVIKSGLEAGLAAPREMPAERQGGTAGGGPASRQETPRETNGSRTAAPPLRMSGSARPQLRVVDQEAAPEPEPQDWRSTAVLTSDGKVKRGSFHNAVVMLAEAFATGASGIAAGGIAFDDFTAQVMLLSRPPWALNGFQPRPVTDVDAAAAANWLDANGVTISERQAFSALMLLADENHINPVRDALNGYVWDETPRLDHWLCDHMGAPDTSFVRAAAAKWLIGAVARIMRPGAKVDTMLILEGPQGLKKSMALAELAEFGGRSYFTDDLHALGSKDAALQLHGNVIVELAELDALERAEVKQIKAFLTRQVDKFRKPYGRVVEPSPRQCVFAGTVNPDGTGYLRDPTGGRRFWPVPVSHVDAVKLREVREQLWAEARVRYEAGESWWLEDDAVIEQARAAQEERQDEDPLLAKLPRWLFTREQVTAHEVLTDCWGFLSNQCTAGAAQRVGRAMKKIGWQRVLVRTGADRSWVYRPPAVEET